MKMWPVNYRFIASTDKNRSNVFYSSNGCLLEQFQVENDEVCFLERWKIWEDGTAITGITNFDDDHKTGCLLLTGENHFVLFDPNHGRIENKVRITDRIICCKKLEFLYILTARKKLLIYDFDGEQFKFQEQMILGTKSTIFSGSFVGDSFQDLVIYTGDIMGKIEVFKAGLNCPILTIAKHEGMVFGICMFGNKIYSISDDRSLRVFDHDSGNEIGVFYGHETRPRTMMISEDGQTIFTAGDSLCIWKWNENGLFLAEKQEPGIGKIYSLTLCQDFLIAASVSGSLLALGMKKKPIQKQKISKFDGLVLRSFVKSAENCYFVIDLDKRLLFADENGIEILIEHQQLRFDTLKISKSRKFVVATTEWKVFLVNVQTKKYCVVSTANVLGGTIFARDSLIVASKTGQALTLKLKNGILSKKEWKINMKANLSTGIVHQDYVIFGFHLGSIAIYSTLEESPEELSRFKVSKRGDPVLDMHVTDSRLFVLTRDGKYSIFCLDDFPELTLLEVVTTIETPARFYFEPINDQRFIWGFRGSEFALSSIDTPVPLVSFECGGGNRILDLSPTYRKGKLTGFKYEYIARGVLQLVDFDLPLVQHIRGPYHKFTIFGLTTITHPEMPSILTAGVDTEIQLHVVDDQGIARRKWTSSFHSSSVHSLASLQTTKNEVLVSSCGGNSQVKVWKASKDSLKVQAEFQGTPTFRYVSNAMVEFNGRIFIFAAASIRELHFFEFLVPEKKVDRLKIWENVEYSTFIKVDCFATNENICLFAAATSGFAYCFEWNPSNDNDIQFIQVKCLDCGLSAICSMKEDKLAATGGESGEICLVDFAKEEVAAKLDNVHFSTIPDICCTKSDDDWLIATVSTDLKVVLTRVLRNNSGFELQVLKQSMTNVGDPMALTPAFDDKSFLIAGQGFEIVEMF